MKKLWERLKILFTYGEWVSWPLEFVSDISVEEMTSGQWGWVEILFLGVGDRFFVLGHDRLLKDWNVTHNRMAHLVVKGEGYYHVYPRPGWKPRRDLAPVDPNHPAWRWLAISNKPRGS